MKVLQITGEYPPMRGGIADYTRGLAAALAPQGVAAAVLTAQAAGGQPNAQEDRAEVLPWVERWDWGLSGTAQRAAVQVGADLAHLQFQTGAFALHPAANLLPWLLARRGLPVVTTMHDLRTPYLFPKAGPLRGWANRLLLRSSAAVIATNPQDYARIRRQAGSVPAYLVPLANQMPPCPPHGYERTAFRRRRGWEGRFVVAHFGMVNHSKGADALVEAAAILRDRGEPVLLAFIGEAEGASDPTNRTVRSELVDLIRALRLGGHTTWTGHLPPEEVSALLLAADAAALPFTDGASFRRTTLLATLAHGLPLVTTEPEPVLNSTPEIAPADMAEPMPELRHGQNCLLVPRLGGAAPALDLAGALLRLRDDAELAQRLAEGGRRLAAHFSWERAASATAAIYADVLRRRGL